MKNQKLLKKFIRNISHAGADIIQTNTYGANAIKLERYGLENQVKELMKAAIQIAKELLQHGGQFVLGTIGGIRGYEKVMQH